MKFINYFISAALCLASFAQARAQYDVVSCTKRPFTTRLVQIDQMDNSTVFYFEYDNDGNRYFNVFEDIVVRDQHGNNYQLLNSYNMPLCDEDHSTQLLLSPYQSHRFALEFDKVSLDEPLDIIESAGNSRAMNFYEVLVDKDNTTSKIDYDQWIKGYPVKEAGSYVENGEVIQYIAYKGVLVTAHMTVTDEYGKYYTIDLDIQNQGDKDFLLDPAQISAKSFIEKKKKDVEMKVLSAEDYDKRIRRTQNWEKVFAIAADVAVTAAAVAVEASADKHDHHHGGPVPPPPPGPAPRHLGWRPANVSHHPYYPTDHYRDRYHSHNMGGLTVATAAIGTVATVAVFEGHTQKREMLEAGYIQPNTIKTGTEYTAYFHIKHEKTDNLVVSIPLLDETFDFRFQWQNKK